MKIIATTLIAAATVLGADTQQNAKPQHQQQQQKDRPHDAKDLAEKVAASNQRLIRDSVTFSQVRTHLESLQRAASPGADLQIGISLAHLSLKFCLAAGDEWREQARLYSSAAQSAADDSKAMEDEINQPPDAETAKKLAGMDAELAAIQARINSLLAQPSRDQNEELEVKDLQQAAERLRGLIAMVQDLIQRRASAEALKNALTSVNNRRRFFELQSRSAAHQSLGYDFQCIGALQMLRELAEREKIDSFRRKWEEDLNPSPSSAPAAPPAAAAPVQRSTPPKGSPSN